MSIVASSRSKTHHIPRSNPGLLFCSHLHHDANRRRREGNGNDSKPPLPRTLLLSGLVGSNGERSALERGALAAMARAQQVKFSAGEGGGLGSKNKAEQAQSGMDAETQRSIGEGDKKSQKSMKTVKVSIRHAARRKVVNARRLLTTVSTGRGIRCSMWLQFDDETASLRAADRVAVGSSRVSTAITSNYQIIDMLPLRPEEK